jgi:hypothetical protein
MGRGPDRQGHSATTRGFCIFSPMNITFHTPEGPLKDFVEYIGFLSGDVIGNGVAFPRSNQVIIINI